MKQVSTLRKERTKYQPKLPSVFTKSGMKITVVPGKKTTAANNSAQIRKLFKNVYGTPTVTFKADNKAKHPVKNVAVILSGGQAPGGHNVIAGIFDALKAANKKNKLYGFLGGPSGLTDNNYIEITATKMNQYRNSGGFDIIGSGRTKLETKEQFDTTRKNLEELGISALVVIGGDDSNTNAALLAEYFAAEKTGIQVIGVPKTIDGDLKNDQIETSFGFDTAAKCYSELVGNICRDVNSAKKYWHFVKLMGRSASHIALEVALQTQPNITIISEEVASKKKTLKQVVGEIVNIIVKRSKKGKDFGVILIPEGLIEFIPEVKKLIGELNDMLAKEEKYFKTLETADERSQFINRKLSSKASHLYSSLPWSIQQQLIMDRDPHGNVQVSRIETEKLLIELVEEWLSQLEINGKYKGKFSAQNHFFGYEGRCVAPSNFDADYCYSLGYGAAALIQAGVTGYMSSVKNLDKPATKWIAGGVPLTMMMNMERRHGKATPVIKKALVELKGNPYKKLIANKKEWVETESFLDAGPIQYFGPPSVCDQPTETLKLEKKKR